MTYAYDESCLENAMDCLGYAFDYAINARGISGQEFIDLFVTSRLSREFESGNPRVVIGMSGKQLADEVFESCFSYYERLEDYNGDYSAEYWCGWIITYCQWRLNISFRKMFNVLSFDDFINTYNVLHEASKEKAFSVFLEKIKSESFLARMRKKRNITQAELAMESCVSLRSIQLYEQRVNDINKAQYNSLKRISSALCCQIEDITEPEM